MPFKRKRRIAVSSLSDLDTTSEVICSKRQRKIPPSAIANLQLCIAIAKYYYSMPIIKPGRTLFKPGARRPVAGARLVS